MISSKGTIVYVGPMSFPFGGAGARRILGNSLSFILAGYNVLIGSGQMPKKIDKDTQEFQGISVVSVGERIAEDKPVLLKHLTYSGMGRKTIKWLNTLDPKPVAIILYSGDFPYLIRLMPWCKKHSIPLIYEACEWFDPVNVPGGRFSPYRLNHEITMHFLVPRVKNVLAISSYLSDHYQKLGCETIIVPPTIDSYQYQPVTKAFNDNIITISYTGSPGKKDLFDNYLEAFLQVDKNGDRFRFNVAGLTDNEILDYPSMKKRKFKKLPVLINSVGHVSHSEAINLVGNSDFSILLRFPKRYANAGFPTKVVESMVMGTPVICNLTSDLNEFILDGTSGIVCEDFHVKSLINSLLRVEKLSANDILNMSQNARKVAEASFDYRLYSAVLDDFIKRIKQL